MHLLGLYLVTMETFVCSNKPKCAKPITNGSQLKAAICRVVTILMNGLGQTNNLYVEFNFHSQPKLSLFISSDTNCASTN